MEEKHLMPTQEAGRNFIMRQISGSVVMLDLLIRQQSVESFMAFAQDEEYMTGIGHRTAALEDSRLLPLVPHPVNSGRKTLYHQCLSNN